MKGIVLPVDYERAGRSIATAIDLVKPRLALGFGLAAGREKITPEKVAVSYRSSARADSVGRKMKGSAIDKALPDGIFTNLPVEGLIASLNGHGITASLSLSAGSYICNNAMFVIVHEARTRGFGGGFVHVPYHSEWIAKKRRQTPSLPVETLHMGAEQCIEYCLRHRANGGRAVPVRV